MAQVPELASRCSAWRQDHERQGLARRRSCALGLSLLGHQNVQQIELVVQFTTPAVSGPQLAILYTFWLKQGNKWTAVWLSDEYQSYKAGKCYLTPQGPPLY